MRDGPEPYDIYRIYGLDEGTAKLRVAKDLKEFATGVISILDRLPSGVTADGISVKPDSISFGSELIIDLPADESAEDE